MPLARADEAPTPLGIAAGDGRQRTVRRVADGLPVLPRFPPFPGCPSGRPPCACPAPPFRSSPRPMGRISGPIVISPPRCVNQLDCRRPAADVAGASALYANPARDRSAAWDSFVWAFAETVPSLAGDSPADEVCSDPCRENGTRPFVGRAPGVNDDYQSPPREMVMERSPPAIVPVTWTLERSFSSTSAVRPTGARRRPAVRRASPG